MKIFCELHLKETVRAARAPRRARGKGGVKAGGCGEAEAAEEGLQGAVKKHQTHQASVAFAATRMARTEWKPWMKTHKTPRPRPPRPSSSHVLASFDVMGLLNEEAVREARFSTAESFGGGSPCVETPWKFYATQGAQELALKVTWRNLRGFQNMPKAASTSTSTVPGLGMWGFVPRPRTSSADGQRCKRSTMRTSLRWHRSEVPSVVR